MAVNAIYTIEKNRSIARDVYEMRLMGPTDVFSAPGQFVNIHLEGFYLRRPLSVCDWDESGLWLTYKVMGQGTSRLAMYGPGTQLDVLAGLGNGFDVAAAAGRKTVLAGGGCGVPPLYRLAKELVAAGGTPIVALGFASLPDVFYKEAFEALGCEVLIATENGTLGERGYVTNILQNVEYDYYYTCGPQGMLAAVHALGRQKDAGGQLSFEERMGCGFGACMGCSCQTLAGPKRICREGPVMDAGEISFAEVGA